MKRSRDSDVEHLGPWQVVSKIGQGGCAEVFEAEYVKGKVRKAALKIDLPGAAGRETPVRNEYKVSTTDLRSLRPPCTAADADLGAALQTLQKLQEAGCCKICPLLPSGHGSTEDGRFYMALMLCGQNMSSALLAAESVARSCAVVRSAGTVTSSHPLSWTCLGIMLKRHTVKRNLQGCMACVASAPVADPRVKPAAVCLCMRDLCPAQAAH